MQGNSIWTMSRNPIKKLRQKIWRFFIIMKSFCILMCFSFLTLLSRKLIPYFSLVSLPYCVYEGNLMGFFFLSHSYSDFYFPPWTYNNLNFKSHLHLIFFPSSYYTYCVYFLKCFRQSGKWHNNNIKNLNMQFMEIFISVFKGPMKFFN